MKIQYASDLHLDFTKNKQFIQENPILPEGEVLVLAGDVVPLARMEDHRDFFKYCADHFKATYWIAGNHEYYHGDLKGRTGTFIKNIESNVHLVNNYRVHLDNARLIFSTLWTPISSDKAWQIQTGLNDYNFIKNDDKRFTPETSTKLFTENLEYIKQAVENNEHDCCIVVTHHVPTLQNYPEEYKSSILNEAFAVDLDAYIESAGIDCWIYGHHHRNAPEFSIGSTKMLTNQLGYVETKEHLGFRSNKLIDTKSI